MGRYIDWAAVVDRYKTIAATTGETDIENSYLLQAEDEVDARLAVRYTVPFTPVPGVVADLCTDLTYYKIKLGSEHADKVWEYLERRFAAITSGTLLLTVSGTVVPTVFGADGSFNTDPYRSSFGPDSAPNWSPDPNWVRNAKGERGV